MTAAIDVIHGGLELLGAHSAPLNPAPPETINRALTVLGELVKEWEGEDFDVGAAVPSLTTSALNEFKGARSALEYGLMFKVAPYLRLAPTPQAAAEGRKVIRQAREKWQYSIPDERHPKQVPGQGNWSR